MTVIEAHRDTPEAHPAQMNRSRQPDFADRMSTAAEATKARLERAARAKEEADNPAAVERRVAREAVKTARAVRTAERRAAESAQKARQVTEIAAAHAAASAAQAAARKAEEEASEAEFAARIEREALLDAERQTARDARYAARKARKRKGK